MDCIVCSYKDTKLMINFVRKNINTNFLIIINYINRIESISAVKLNKQWYNVNWIKKKIEIQYT